MPANTRLATAADAPAIGQLLYDFNTEYDDPVPAPEWIADRITQLLGKDDMVVLLAGDPPVGIAMLRLRDAWWSNGLECYLAELYVVPAHRGRGLGRALMNCAIELSRERGAVYMDLNTGETDRAARSLYESLGFTHTGGKPDGPVNFYYELEL